MRLGWDIVGPAGIRPQLRSPAILTPTVVLAKVTKLSSGSSLHKSQIEDRFGGELEWALLEGRRACRIKKVVPIVGWQDDSRWPEAHDELIDTMIRFSGALQPYIKELKSK